MQDFAKYPQPISRQMKTLTKQGAGGGYTRTHDSTLAQMRRTHTTRQITHFK